MKGLKDTIEFLYKKLEKDKWIAVWRITFISLVISIPLLVVLILIMFL